MDSTNAITIVAPKSLQETEQLSRHLAKSMLLPQDLKGKECDIMTIILTGAELGLAPMQSIRGIQVIKGKPSLSADLMGALCKRRPDICEYLQLVEATPTRAIYKTKRVGEKETTMSFTMEDAKAAELTSSGMYKKYPVNMLRARCLSNICRAVYPDLCQGLYDSDSGELTDGVVSSAPVEREVNEAPKTRTEATKEKLKAKLHVIDVAPGQSEADAIAAAQEPEEAPAPTGPTPYERCATLYRELGGTDGKKLASLIKGATGRSWKEVTEADVDGVMTAIKIATAPVQESAPA